MQGKEKAEQAEILRSYMQEHMGVAVEDKPMVQLSDDQVRMIVDGASQDAQKIAETVGSEIERKYNLNAGQSRALVQETAESAYEQQKHRQRDLHEAAKVIRAVSRASVGKGEAGGVEKAYEAERQYLKETGRAERAMSLTTDTTGGYLGGEIFSTMLYDNVARVSQARKYCTQITMEREILRLPKLTSTFTAEQTAEATGATSSQPVFAQFTLTTKKINVLSKPFSVELLETADPALVQTLINFATIELAKKEDSIVFANILAQTANVVDMAAGESAITDLTFDHMADLINELDEQYLPDEDIKGSGMIGGEARFWMPRKVINVLAKSKGNDNYHWANVQELKSDKRVHGFELKRVVSMEQAPAAETKFGLFGNLGYHICGVRPGYRIELQSQGTVDSVNLNETNSYALRVTEFFDSDTIDDEAMSILKTGTAS
jgi:HK97 family phage major capsid protein